MRLIVRKFTAMKVLVLVFVLGMGANALASVDTYEFSDPGQQALYLDLVQELRCLVCQNQNIADSNAELAQDLRRKTYEMVKKGESKDQIVEFMVTRYGDFVMYSPPFKATTLMLWVGPALIFVFAVAMLVRVIRRRPSSDDRLLSDEQRQRAEQLLNQTEEK
ncbi:cytochrome c-type biogenesis protein [Thiolapillus sp.]